MATKKSTTRKKTTKTTAASRTSKAAVVKQEAKTNGTLLGISVLVYLGLAIAAGVLMRGDTASLTLTHVTNDLLLSQNGTAFVPAIKPVFDLEFRWVVTAILLLSAVTPILYLTKLKNYYAEGLTKRKFIGLRWVDLAVTSALMVETIAILIGYTDIMALKLMGALIGATCLLSWLAEKQNAASKTPVWNAFGVGVFTGVMPWLAIGAAHFGTLLYSTVRSPWYVYAVCWSTLIGFSLIGLAQYRRYQQGTDYIQADRKYLTYSMLTKVAFATILIVGLMK